MKVSINLKINNQNKQSAEQSVKHLQTNAVLNTSHSILIRPSVVNAHSEDERQPVDW